MHPHPNEKPRQKKIRLTDITYVNKGYNTKIPPQTKSMSQRKEQYLKVHIEPQNSSLEVIIKKKQSHADLARYLHATCLLPVRVTFTITIILFYFKTWTGLTPKLITNNLPPVIATTQGHFHQDHQKLQSTKKQTNINMKK